jgi:microcystin-dependent protein
VAAAGPGMLGYTVSSTAPDGWVLAAGRTIGSAASGATERANADTAALFAILWAEDATAFPITTSAGVASTRGASAAVDFAANKRLPLPDLRGRSVAGKDNAGGTPANRLTSAGSGVDATKVGLTGGGQAHTLTTAHMPAHNHGVTDPGHGHGASQDAHSHTSDNIPMSRSAAGYGLAAPGSGYTERVALYVNSTSAPSAQVPPMPTASTSQAIPPASRRRTTARVRQCRSCSPSSSAIRL